MNTKTTVKILLDILMTIVYIALIDAYGTGLAFHEIAGLSIFVVFMVHILLNWSWVKNITGNLFNVKLKEISRLQYILNVMLFISISVITITGILISQVLFTISENARNSMLIALHKYASYYCFGLLIFHIALHWRYLIASIGKIGKNIQSYNVKKVILRFGAALMITGLLYSQIISKAEESLNSSLVQNTPNYAVPEQEILAPNKDEYNQKEVISEGKTKENTDNIVTEDKIVEEKIVVEETVSLAEFLGNMFCTACPKHCSLLNPRCGRAQPQIQAAKIEYQKIYGNQ